MLAPVILLLPVSAYGPQGPATRTLSQREPFTTPPESKAGLRLHLRLQVLYDDACHALVHDAESCFSALLETYCMTCHNYDMS